MLLQMLSPGQVFSARQVPWFWQVLGPHTGLVPTGTVGCSYYARMCRGHKHGDSHITARCGPFLKTLSNFVLIVITRGDYMWGLIKTKRGARKKENKSTFSTRLYFPTPSSERFKCTIILVQPGKKTESYRHSQPQLQSLVPMLRIWGPLILLLVPGWQGSLGNQSWTLSAWVVSRT